MLMLALCKIRKAAACLRAIELGCGLAAALLLCALPATARAEPRKIVGPNACAECHKEETEVWKGTHHFSSFREMPRSKEARKIADKLKIKRIKSSSLCLNCHFTAKGGRKKAKPIAGISCESCHAPAKDWIKRHSEFSGKTEATETKEDAAARWQASEARGMIRPSALYKLAKNCFSCHVVPQEKLVNRGGHPAGSAFELVSWSQGEVRHNLWRTKGKSNTIASAERRRILFVIGLIAEVETAHRSVGIASKRQVYALKMAARADAARKKLAAAAKAVPQATELGEIVRLSHSAALKLDNGKALNAAADEIAREALIVLANYDGSSFSALDSMIPAPKDYKGTPVK